MKTIIQLIEERIPKESQPKAKEVIEQVLKGLSRSTRGLDAEIKEPIYLILASAIQLAAKGE